MVSLQTVFTYHFHHAKLQVLLRTQHSGLNMIEQIQSFPIGVLHSHRSMRASHKFKGMYIIDNMGKTASMGMLYLLWIKLYIKQPKLWTFPLNAGSK